MEVEDDVFFADLNRRISLLIMDDDEEVSVVSYPSVSVQGFTMMGIHPSMQVQSSQFTHMQNGSSTRRECKGTGVFIPQSAHPRRRNRQGRFLSSSSNTKNTSRSNLPQPTTYNLPSNNNINNTTNYYCYNSFGKNRC
ncbi:uncharacterized protein LOC124922661 [Impatiens glandulifera]|uniref:uncharacterized protein LOC124922661 n=1 Tax=Impatiens glandulifera TaxID=253017 RepID=UPI001FB0AFB2|nr:uncharacterized protein LOC124922661 [Impatiens glandulifera]